MNKVFLALAVPLVFTAFGCSKTTEIDPTTPVAISPHPAVAPQASNSVPSTTPVPQDTTTPSTTPAPQLNGSSDSSSTPSQGTELNTQPQSPSAATDAQTSQSKD